MKKQNNVLSFAIGGLIAIPLVIYANGQQELNAEAQKNDFRPVSVAYIVESPEPTAEAVEMSEEKEYFDVPLSEELQDHIFAECEKHNISPAIVIAMIERESRFKESATGDDGCSMGLMQIQRKWHEERMQALGCDDLLDAFQNVTVGIDYLAELKGRNNDLYWVLMAYNGGPSYANKRIGTGNISDYALEVTERAVELESGWN